MRFPLCLVAMCLVTAPGWADSADDLDARASLALHAACGRQAAPIAAKPGSAKSIDLAKPLTLEQAEKVARTKHVPVLLRVGPIDCTSLCSKLRPDVPTCHTDAFAGDATPRLQLLYADGHGRLWASNAKWASPPPEATVRKAAAEFKTFVDGKTCTCASCPEGACPCGCCDAAPAPATTWTFAPNGCPNGHCPRR